MSEKEIHLYKAQPVDWKAVQSLVIKLVDPFPDDITSLKMTEEIHIQQAQVLCDALYDTLPGGTVDQLIALLMARRSSLLVVPHWRDSNE